MHIDFDFALPIGRTNKIARPKNRGRRSSKFVKPCYNTQTSPNQKVSDLFFRKIK